MVAWALVKWLNEDRVSVIPSTWVVKPSTVDNIQLPVNDCCYWKKKSVTYDTEILDVSGEFTVYSL